MQDRRLAWARLLHSIDPQAEPAKAQAVGSVHQALLSGVLVQWLTDPGQAPSASDLASGLRVIAADMSRGEPRRTSTGRPGHAMKMA